MLLGVSCRGSYSLGSGCGKCRKCVEEKKKMQSEKMPIGEWIEVLIGYEYEKFKPKYSGNYFYFGEMVLGEEVSVSKDVAWRYTKNPKDTLRGSIMRDWKSQKLDSAWDSWSDIDTEWLLQWMLDNGVSVE